MTTQTRTYKGGARRVSVPLPSRIGTADRGEPVDFTDDEAALLGDDWTEAKAPAPKKATATKAKATTEPAPSGADTQEA